MQARQISRELALLSLSHLPNKVLEGGEAMELEEILLAAIRMLGSEAREGVEEASGEITHSSEQLLQSDLTAVNVNSARAMLQESLDHAEKAVNHLRRALELPEMLQMTNRKEVQSYALELARSVKRNQAEINPLLDGVMEGWRLNRLPRIDQDILRLAIAEIQYLGLAAPVAINAAVELAKRYSDEEGRRLINGVLRRAMDRLRGQANRQTEAQD